MTPSNREAFKETTIGMSTHSEARNVDDYTASDGSLWHIRATYPPIPTRAYDWEGIHDDYDGAPDAHDNRVVNAADPEEVIVEIERLINEERQ